MTSGRFHQRVALVTGAARGIGRAIAVRLAAEGAHVVVSDVDAAGAEETAEAIRGTGQQADGAWLDVTDADSRTATITATCEQHGPIDILVNNAGIFTAQQPLEVSLASWRRTFAVNTEALFFCCQEVLPIMVERGYGRIVNLSSIAAKVGNPTMIAYNASKAAVMAITRNLGVAFAREGVTVNCVLPGIVDTPMWEDLNENVGPMLGYPRGTLMEDRAHTIPVGRVGRPADVAAVVAFLASEDAGYMTGQSINVTGGLLTL